MTPAEFQSALINIISSAFPFLKSGSLGVHKGRVIAVHTGGDNKKAHATAPVISVDIEEIDYTGDQRPTGVVIPSVPVDISIGADETGISFVPRVGALVRYGFYGGNPLHPYIAGFIQDSSRIRVQEGLLLAVGPTEIHLKPDGSVLITATSSVEIRADTVAGLTSETCKLESDGGAQVLVTGNEVQIKASSILLGDESGLPKPIARVGDAIDIPPLFFSSGLFSGFTTKGVGYIVSGSATTRST